MKNETLTLKEESLTKALLDVLRDRVMKRFFYFVKIYDLDIDSGEVSTKVTVNFEFSGFFGVTNIGTISKSLDASLDITFTFGEFMESFIKQVEEFLINEGLEEMKVLYKGLDEDE